MRLLEASKLFCLFNKFCPADSSLLIVAPKFARVVFTASYDLSDASMGLNDHAAVVISELENL